MAANYVKFYRGTTAKYQAVVKAGNVNSDTLYFIQDNGQAKGALYLGTTLISKDLSNFYELEDINLADVLHNNDLLVYSEKQEKWVNKSILDAIGIFVGAKDGKQGTNGLVPAPGENSEKLFLRGDGVWAAPETETTITIDVDNKTLIDYETTKNAKYLFKDIINFLGEENKNIWYQKPNDVYLEFVDPTGFHTGYQKQLPFLINPSSTN